MNEMWRVRQKELELDKRLKVTSRDKSCSDRSHRDGNSSRSMGRLATVDDGDNSSTSCSSKRDYDHCPEGLRDDELEKFLNSRYYCHLIFYVIVCLDITSFMFMILTETLHLGRTKRGRGAVGPRMDETGPYLPFRSDEEPMASSDVRDRRVYGPEKPPSLKSYESSEEEYHVKRQKKAKKSHSGSSDKEHSKKHRSKENSKHKKKKRKEKRCKHHN